MSWKEIYKPTIAKLIVPIIIYIWVLIRIVSIKTFFFCRVDCATDISYRIGLGIMYLIAVVLIVYPISCWIVALVNKFKR